MRKKIRSNKPMLAGMIAAALCLNYTAGTVLAAEELADAVIESDLSDIYVEESGAALFAEELSQEPEQVSDTDTGFEDTAATVDLIEDVDFTPYESTDAQEDLAASQNTEDLSALFDSEDFFEPNDLSDSDHFNTPDDFNDSDDFNDPDDFNEPADLNDPDGFNDADELEYLEDIDETELSEDTFSEAFEIIEGHVLDEEMPEEDIVSETALLAASAEEENTCGVDGAAVTYMIEDGVLAISGKGAIRSYSTSDRAPWYSFRSAIKKVVIAEGVTKIGEAAFLQLYNVTEVDIADSVSEIGRGAFSNCTALTTIRGMQGVTTIKEYAFELAPITSFTIPAGVTSFDPIALLGCAKLTAIQVAPGNLSYTAYDGVLYTDNGTTALFCPAARTGSVIIPDGVTKIGASAFVDTKITSIRIPSSVTEIDDWAFTRSALTSLTVPASVTKLGNGIVDSSKTITELYIYASIEKLPYRTAYQASNLRTVVIANPITGIGNLAFYSCQSLVSVTLPDTLQKIGTNAFGGNTSLVTISLPEALKTIESHAFAGDTALTTVNIPAGIENIGAYAFKGCSNLIWSAPESLTEISEGVYSKTVTYSQDVYEDYTKAFEVLALVNQEREKVGAAPLKMDTSLLESAMFRANETSIYFSHTRPCGLDCYSVNRKMNGENIAAGSSTSEGTMYQWMHSSGHKANILNSSFKSIGVGCVQSDGGYYWVQCFSREDADGEASENTYNNAIQNRSVLLKADGSYLNLVLNINNRYAGKAAEIQVYNNTDGWYQYMNPEMFEFTSSDPSIAVIEGDRITVSKAGTITVSAALKNNPNAKVSKEFTFERQTGMVTAGKTYYRQAGSEEDQTIQLTANANDGQAITWKSDADWAVVDQSGMLTIAGGNAGNATITAEAAQTDVYTAASATIKVYINKLYNSISGDYYTYMTVPAGVQSFALPYTAKGGATLSYSSDTEGVSIASDGTMIITDNISGYVKINVQVEETALYYGTSRTMYLYIKRSAPETDAPGEGNEATPGTGTTPGQETTPETGTTPGTGTNPGTETIPGTETTPGTQTTRETDAGPEMETEMIPAPKPVHVHEYGEWITVKDADALHEGVQRQYCSCGKYREKTIPKLTATVKVNYSYIPLKKGQKTSAIQAYGLATGDSIKSWTSSNKKVATVNKNGKITAKKKTGTAVITVKTKAGATASVTVKVQPKKVKASKIALPTGKTIVMTKGQKISINPSVTPVTATGTFKYTSNKKKVATVNAKGVITARKKGKATITVSYGGKKVKLKVTVK